MRQYIKTCSEIEKTVAQIYQELSESEHFGGDVRRMFHTLANDENDHAMQLDFALRLPTVTIALEQNMLHQQAAGLLTRAKNSLQKVTQKALSVAEAVALGIGLEENFCGIHLNNSVNFQDESMKKMFSAMARDEKIHKNQLLEFRAALEDQS